MRELRIGPPLELATDVGPVIDADAKENFGSYKLLVADVVDGQLVSGRAWPDHPGWMREFMRLLRAHAPVEPAAAGATA